MNFGKSLRSLIGITRNAIQKRGVSEYSKRMGYKPKDIQVEGRVNVPEILLCLGITGYLVYDIYRDQTEHHKALMESFDRHEKYYDHQAGLGMFPPMDFLVDKLFYFPQGDQDKSHDSMETNIREKCPSTLAMESKR